VQKRSIDPSQMNIRKIVSSAASFDRSGAVIRRAQALLLENPRSGACGGRGSPRRSRNRPVGAQAKRCSRTERTTDVTDVSRARPVNRQTRRLEVRSAGKERRDVAEASVSATEKPPSLPDDAAAERRAPSPPTIAPGAPAVAALGRIAGQEWVRGSPPSGLWFGSASA
jgi:hypothetical protein